MKPWGVQLASPIVAPGRATRTSSSAAAWWCGANMTPTLGVTLLPVEQDPCFFGLVPADVEERGREVAGDDVRAGTRGRDRGVARPGGDVEDVLARRDTAGVDEDRAERRDDLPGHGRVVAERPQGGVSGLELRVRGRGRRRLGVRGHAGSLHR